MKNLVKDYNSGKFDNQEKFSKHVFTSKGSNRTKRNRKKSSEQDWEFMEWS